MKILKITTLLLIFSLILSSCGKPAKKEVKFSDDSAQAFPTLVDTAATEKIQITKDLKLNQTALVTYKSFSPDGSGVVEYKAKKISEIKEAGTLKPSEGNKLVLLEFSYKGSDKNKGQPSIINQIGETPAPQFVFLDTVNNKSYVETTDFSDAYAASKKLFQLYKLTLDNNKVVDTAMVFEVPSNLSNNIAIRFTNPDGKTEFYSVK